MQVPVDRNAFIAQTKIQIANIERRQAAISATISDFQLAAERFEGFIKNPNLMNAGVLAEGLFRMARAQLHGFQLEQKFIAENLEGLRNNLRMAESTILVPNLAPPSGIGGKH